MSRSGPRPVILWFRNDLRLRDNEALHLASLRAKTGATILPVFIFDTRWFGPSAVDSLGIPRTQPFRARFIQESVSTLRSNLSRTLGLPLLVAAGIPETLLPQLANSLSTSGEGAEVICNAEVCSEETGIERRVERGLSRVGGGCVLTRVWGGTMYHRDDLPRGATLEEVAPPFTKWRKTVEGETTPVRAEIATPCRQDFPPLPNTAKDSALSAIHNNHVSHVSFTEVPPIEWLAGASPIARDPSNVRHAGTGDSRGGVEFKGGEDAAMERLNGWMFSRDRLKSYLDTRNGLIGSEYSSKLSPWLACGCLSPRTVYWAVDAYEKERGASKSTYWLVFELLWRDFFHFWALSMGSKLFQLHGDGKVQQAWVNDEEGFKAWSHGRTGFPLVDAGMRELRATGFMSNRARQNVASFLALDLRIDWRKGAAVFESFLLDYDPASNHGNWYSVAGLTGGRVNRFNIAKQGRDYDPNGEYVKLWVPELTNVPKEFIHEPWRMPGEVQTQVNCVIGRDYPTPLRQRFEPPTRKYGDGTTDSSMRRSTGHNDPKSFGQEKQKRSERKEKKQRNRLQ